MSESSFKGFIRRDWLPIVVVIINFIVGLCAYNILPDRIPMHWNVAGQVDSYGSKMWGVIGFPSIIFGIYILMTILPAIDPKWKNYRLFEGTYSILKSVLVLVFTAIYLITLLPAIGYNLRIDKVVPFVMSIMIIVMGNYMGRIKQNFFVGIKTPWTLNDNEIWTKTHRLAGKLWVAGGIVTAITSIVLSGIASFVTFMVVILGVSFYPILHSYILFAKKKGKE